MLTRSPNFMNVQSRVFTWVLLSSLLTTNLSVARPQWVISGNENKIDLASGVTRTVPNAALDSLSLLDFSQFPPSIQHLTNISNSVLGPPSNIAIHPDGTLALIADSIQLDPANPEKWIPAHRIHVLDLKQHPPRVIQEVEAGTQPSGLSFSPDGHLALVANRAGGSVSVLSVDSKQASVRVVGEVLLAQPADEVSDVAFTPDGKKAFVSVREKNLLRELLIQGTTVTATTRKFSTYGRPYRVLVTPDGGLLLTAGSGAGNGPDVDAMTVIDLDAKPARTTDLVRIGFSPESIELSPDGRWLVAVMMEGSNLPPEDPARSERGWIVLLERKARTFEVRQRVPVGRIPEGAAFSPDGKHLVVQCHPDRKLWIFDVTRSGLRDTGIRLDVPGMPSGIRSGKR